MHQTRLTRRRGAARFQGLQARPQPGLSPFFKVGDSSSTLTKVETVYYAPTMSFGFSGSDIVWLVKLSATTVINTRKAYGEYAELTQDVARLNVVLQRLQKETGRSNNIFERPGSLYKDELASIARGCKRHLQKLNEIVEKYDKLNVQEEGLTKLWKKAKFGNIERGALKDLKSKITHDNALLGLYINLISAGSIGRVEGKMNEAGGDLKHIRSAVNDITVYLMSEPANDGSVLTAYSGDDRNVWRAFRRELVKDGFSSSVIQKHKSTIQSYVKELGSRGVLDNIRPMDEDLEAQSYLPSDGNDPISTRTKGESRELFNSQAESMIELTSLNNSYKNSSSHVTSRKTKHFEIRGAEKEPNASKVSSIRNSTGKQSSVIHGLLEHTWKRPSLSDRTPFVEPFETETDRSQPLRETLYDNSATPLSLNVSFKPLDRILYDYLDNRNCESSKENIIAAMRIKQWKRRIAKEYCERFPDEPIQAGRIHARLRLLHHAELVLHHWDLEIWKFQDQRSSFKPNDQDLDHALKFAKKVRREIQKLHKLRTRELLQPNRPSSVENLEPPSYKTSDTCKLSWIAPEVQDSRLHAKFNHYISKVNLSIPKSPPWLIHTPLSDAIKLLLHTMLECPEKLTEKRKIVIGNWTFRNIYHMALFLSMFPWIREHQEWYSDPLCLSYVFKCLLETFRRLKAQTDEVLAHFPHDMSESM